MSEVIDIKCACEVPWWVFAASIWLGMILGKADNRYGGPAGDWLAAKVKEVWRFFGPELVSYLFILAAMSLYVYAVFWATFHTN